MELQELITFVTVAKCGRFSKASEQLGYSQSAVTVQIRNLEKELGVRLLDRFGKTVSLTCQGQQFYEHALQVIHDVQKAREAVSDSAILCGVLRIGTIDSISTSIMPGILKRYHKKHHRVTLQVTTDTPSTLLRMLCTNELDMVYLVDEELLDPKLVKVINVDEKVVFVTSANCCSGEEFDLQTVLSMPLILTEKDASYRRVLDDMLLRSGIHLEPYMETNSTDLILNMVKDGLGISFLPEYTLTNQLIEQQLVKFEISSLEVNVKRQVVYHKDKWVSPEMRSFFEQILQEEEEGISS